MSKKDVVVKKDFELSKEDMTELYDVEITSNDVIIPKLLIMQPGSDAVIKKRIAQPGEFRNSSTNELLGDIDSKVKVIPFYCERLWRNLKKINGMFKFVGYEPVTRFNSDRKWEYKKDGEDWRAVYTLMYYVLLPRDVEEGTPTPYTLSFSSTSVIPGKELYTRMYTKNKQLKAYPFSYLANIGGSMTTNDKGTFVVLNYETGREASPKEMKAAFEMYKIIKNSKADLNKSDLPNHAEQVNEHVEY